MKGLIGFVLLMAFLGAFWKWILAAVIIVMIAKAVPVAWREHQAERAAERHRLRQLIARADLPHQWVRAGDPRGTYGRYPPAELVPEPTLLTV